MEEEGRRPLREFPVEILDLDDLRRRATAVASDDSTSAHVGMLNSPCYAVFYCIFMALVNAATVAGAYFFLVAAGNSITPRCYVYHDVTETNLVPSSPNSDTWSEWLCNISTFCFWTYPIVGPMIVVCIFWKNLLDIRLYYECLVNRILLDYRAYSYVYSPTFWFLMVYLLTGLSSLIYIKSASASGNKTYRELVYGLLAYFIPVAAFLFVLFSEWTVDWNVVSLPKYLQRDNKRAVDLLARSTFLAEDDMRDAFEATEDLLVRYEQNRSLRTPVQLSTSEYLRLILDVHERGSRPPSRWYCFRLGRNYWVYRVLFSSHLQDARSSSFRLWTWLYTLFIFVSVLVFIWTMVHTAQDLLLFQRTLREPLPIGPSPVDTASQR